MDAITDFASYRTFKYGVSHDDIQNPTYEWEVECRTMAIKLTHYSNVEKVLNAYCKTLIASMTSYGKRLQLRLAII